VSIPFANFLGNCFFECNAKDWGISKFQVIAVETLLGQIYGVFPYPWWQVVTGQSKTLV
jgi:hypothetical protein